MLYDINELYKIQKKDIYSACQVLAQAFHEDPAWIYLIPDEAERGKQLPQIFEYDIRYSLKYGAVYAPTENLEGIAAWVPHTTVQQTLWRILRSGAFRAALKMRRDIGNKLQKLFNQLDKDRTEHMKDRSYFYLQAIGVLPELQGKGFGRRLLQSLLTKSDREDFSIYLETETEQNMKIYTKYGFQTLKEGFISGSDFYLWEMVREPKLPNKISFIQ